MQEPIYATSKSITSSNTTTTTTIDNKRIGRISRFMSFLLRHGLNERSIKCDTEGYILLNELMKQPEMKGITSEMIHHIVDVNDKKRYAIKTENGVDYIRANQGHSKNIGDNIDDDSALTKIITALPLCVHGTNNDAWKDIQKVGLSPMNRKHVHLATGLANDTTVVSGMRKSANVIIHIDMEKAMDRGKTFYMSSNGVVLTSDTLEPDLFYDVTFPK